MFQYVKVDASMGEDWWQETSPLALKPSPVKMRCERVSAAYKEALTSTVATTLGIQTSSQFMKVQSVTKKLQEGSQEATYSFKCQHQLRASTMFQYWRAMRSTTSDLIHLHSSLDGLTCGGEHTVPMIHLVPASDVLVFGPPAVTLVHVRWIRAVDGWRMGDFRKTAT